MGILITKSKVALFVATHGMLISIVICYFSQEPDRNLYHFTNYLQRFIHLPSPSNVEQATFSWTSHNAQNPELMAIFRFQMKVSKKIK